jgi:lysyl-tRNA synthetase class 2
MSQVINIATKRNIIEARARIVYHIRQFFMSEGVLEITTPTLIQYPGQEPNLEAMSVDLRDYTGQMYTAYLHTSPEYTLKKCVAAGYGDVYSMGPAFRNNESFGGVHNPEFTMLEWYRTAANMYAIMDDIDALFAQISEDIPDSMCAKPCRRLHMREVWQQYVGVDLDAYLTVASLFALVSERGYTASIHDSYEALFYTIFVQEIEPHLGVDVPTIVHHYPAPMAALSALSSDDPRYAERFELYIGGVELANAFTELTDATEQLSRLQAEQKERQARGMSQYDIDTSFVDAVGQLPTCAGIALGVDRLVQVLLGCKNIDDVLVLPASQIFKS